MLTSALSLFRPDARHTDDPLLEPFFVKSVVSSLISANQENGCAPRIEGIKDPDRTTSALHPELTHMLMPGAVDPHLKTETEAEDRALLEGLRGRRCPPELLQLDLPTSLQTHL
jgi:hypothetical protein